MVSRKTTLIPVTALLIGVAGCFHKSDNPPDPTVPSASQSTVTVSPISGTAGGSPVTITATVLNAVGDPLSGQNVQFAVTGTGNTVTPITATTNASGVATATLTSTTAETKIVTVTVNPGAGPIIITQSPTVTVTAAAPAQLVFATQPSNGAIGAALTPPIQVRVEDAFGNLVTTAGDSITIALDTNPSGATFSGLNASKPSSGLAKISAVAP